jgi:hypothetical protein
MKPRPLVVTVLVSVVAFSACSSGSSATHHVDQPKPATNNPASVPAGGPAATVAGKLTGGKGINLASASGGPAVPAQGWVEEEFAVEGTATSYRSDAALPADGLFALKPDATADYRTRIVVRRPSTAAKFNGTVVVEWLNVSGGLDASPDFSYARNELVRGGYAWVGVSAQSIGIEGGPVAVPIKVAIDAGAGRGLRALDPARYGNLHHPGDAFSYDMYTQVARTLRSPKGLDALGGLRPKRVLAVGESQSAFALTTYVDGVQPLTREFDGFLIHSRGGAAAPLGSPGTGIDIAGTIGGVPTKLRTDLAAPILVVETETDLLGVLNYQPASQPDSARFRLWEMAGTAHADTYIIGTIADQIGCAAPANAGPGHFMVSAALHDLDGWVRNGIAPPRAPRLNLDTTPAFVRDQYGNAEGGIRTPLVDVPVDALSGSSAGGSIACILFGSTKPLAAEQLATLYRSRQDYIDKFRTAADAAIKAGFVLAPDRAELLAAAQPTRIVG